MLKRVAFKAATGFTLVELLVVTAILGIALSLVGSFTINQLDNVKRAQEREEIRLLLNEWQFQAFNHRSAVELAFSGSRLAVNRLTSPSRMQTRIKRQVANYDFAFSQFPKQSIIINAHGYANNAQVLLMQEAREFTLLMSDIGTIGGEAEEPIFKDYNGLQSASGADD